MKKWAVISKKDGTIIKTFEEHGEANYYVTDCYGPEWNTVRVVELDSSGQEIKED